MVESRGYAKQLAAAVEELADCPNVATGKHRHSDFDMGRLAHDVVIVILGQVVLAKSGETAVQGGGASRPDEHYVFAQVAELFFVAGAETFSQAHQQQQRAHAPCNSEHGKK